MSSDRLPDTTVEEADLPEIRAISATTAATELAKLRRQAQRLSRQIEALELTVDSVD